MKKSPILVVALIILAGCAQPERGVREYTLDVPPDHPIWEVWMRDAPPDNREQLKKESIRRMNSITYVFRTTADRSHEATMIDPTAPKGFRKSTIPLKRKIVNGAPILFSEEHGIEFHILDDDAYLTYGKRPQDRLPLRKKDI